MSYTLKLLIPIALGVAAAVTNWIVMKGVIEPVHFTVARREIPMGKIIESADLTSVGIPSNLVHKLANTAILAKHQSKIIGQSAIRDIEKDDLLFWTDAPIRGAQLDWQNEDEYAVSVPLNRSSIPPVEVGDYVDFYYSPDASR